MQHRQHKAYNTDERTYLVSNSSCRTFATVSACNSSSPAHILLYVATSAAHASAAAALALCSSCPSLLVQAIFGLSQLHFLTLESHYSGLKEAELLNLPLLPQLQRLSLLNHFSDATLCSLLRCTPQLTHLKLTSCGSVGDVGLGCIVSHCKRLKEVHLELMRGASVAGVAALAAGPCVRRVVVEGCRNVLAEECREVQRLLSKLELEVVKLR